MCHKNTYRTKSLHAFLTASQRHHMRLRAHDRQLPAHHGHLTDFNLLRDYYIKTPVNPIMSFSPFYLIVQGGPKK